MKSIFFLILIITMAKATLDVGEDSNNDDVLLRSSDETIVQDDTSDDDVAINPSDSVGDSSDIFEDALDDNSYDFDDFDTVVFVKYVCPSGYQLKNSNMCSMKDWLLACVVIFCTCFLMAFIIVILCLVRRLVPKVNLSQPLDHEDAFGRRGAGSHYAGRDSPGGIHITSGYDSRSGSHVFAFTPPGQKNDRKSYVLPPPMNNHDLELILSC